MEDNKEKIKSGIKNEMKTILHMIIFNIITFTLIYISNIGAKFTGGIHGDIITVKEYYINFNLAMAMYSLFCIFYYFFNKKFLKNDLKKQLESNTFFIILYFLSVIAFGTIEFFIYFIATFMSIELFISIKNAEIIVIYIILLCVAIVYTLIDCIIEIIRNKKGLRKNEEINTKE